MSKRILGILLIMAICVGCFPGGAGLVLLASDSADLPAVSLLASGYTYSSWKGGGASYIEGGGAEYVEDGGYEAVKITASKTAEFPNETVSQFRLQLEDKFFNGSESFAPGDRVYVSFMARAEFENLSDNKSSFYISSVDKATNSTKSAITNYLRFTLTETWQKYSGFLTLKTALTSDVFARLRFDVGYKGQTTYLSEFKMFKCMSGASDEEVIQFAESPVVINMVKTQELIRAGAGSGDTSKCDLESETVFEPAISDEFAKIFTFTSTEYNNTTNTKNEIGSYKARFQTANIDSSSVSVGDMILFTFWAKGEYTGSEPGMTAMMRPDLQASVKGSGGTSVNRLTASGTSDKTNISVANEWKRYGCVFKVPQSDGYDMQINWHIGCVNQSVSFALPELYNLGQISEADAYACLDDIRSEFVYMTKPMTWEGASLCSARAPRGVYGISPGDFEVITSNPYISVKADVAPHVGAEGVVTITAPNGRQKTVTVKILSYADYEERKPESGFVMNDDGSVSFKAMFGVSSKFDKPKSYIVAVGEYLGSVMTACNFEFVNVTSAGDYPGEVYLENPVNPIKYYKAFAVELPSLKPVSKECVYDYIPPELVAEDAYVFSIVHNSVKNEIGVPAIVEPGGNVPKFSFYAERDFNIEYALSFNGREIFKSANTIVKADIPMLADISDYAELSEEGEYKISLKAQSGDEIFYDALYFYVMDSDAKKSDDSKLVYTGADGKLVYIPDYKGNKIMDFSKAGYKNGDTPVPSGVKVVKTLSPSGGDDTSKIQAALDYVATRSKDSNGIRGAVKLSKGVFKVSSKLSINADGVVLIGSGNDNAKIADAQPTGNADTWAKNNKNTTGTIILLTTTEPGARMLDILGSGGAVKVEGTEQRITDEYVPTGSMKVRVENAGTFKVGDDIIIEQYGNLAWVHEIGMDAIPPRETIDANVSTNDDNSINQWDAQKWQFERKITAIDGNEIYLDIPIAAAIERKWGGAVVCKYTDTGRISNIGIENMRVVAAWSPNSDGMDNTRHAGELVTIKNAKDVWIKNVTTENLFLYNVNIHKSAKRITIEDFYNLIAPKKYYNGPGYDSSGRTFFETGVYVGRYGIYIGGQQVLMQRVHGTNNRHLVEYQSLAAGPNVAVDCSVTGYLAQMGPHMGWSVGGLYDNVTGWVSIQNRLNMGSGHGWAGAWFTAWNCEGKLAVQKPPTAQNYCVGHVGSIDLGSYPEYDQGYRDLQGMHSNIESLYKAQLNNRD